MFSFLRQYSLSVLCLVLIGYLSFFVPSGLPGADVPGLDKLVHSAMYGGLCLIVWWEYVRKHATLYWPRLLTWNVAAPILLGGLVEILQAYCTTTRSGDWWDFAADTLGVLLAFPIGYFCLRPIARRWHTKKS